MVAGVQPGRGALTEHRGFGDDAWRGRAISEGIVRFAGGAYPARKGAPEHCAAGERMIEGKASWQPGGGRDELCERLGGKHARADADTCEEQKTCVAAEEGDVHQCSEGWMMMPNG